MTSIPLILVFLVALVLSSGSAAAAPVAANLQPPLPPGEVRVAPPAPGLPAEIQAFSGQWAGAWIDPAHPESGIQEILVVQEMVSKDDIKVILSWGDCPVCGSQGEARRFSARIANLCIDWRRLPEPFAHLKADGLGPKQVLYFSYPEGRTFTFVLNDQGQLLGTDGEGAVRMNRVK